jgi:transcriptional regulator with XRE-family HTH domain
VTFQQVQKYEKGVNRIAAGRLFDIAEALDAPVTFFYDGIVDKLKDQSSEPAAEKVLATPEGQKLLALFAAIEDPKIRKRILELAIAVAADA